MPQLPDNSAVTVAKNNLIISASRSQPTPKVIEIETEDEFIGFPRLSEKCFYGGAGAVLERLLPYTEADAPSLLFHLLTGFGTMIGRKPHFRVGQAHHFLKLFTVIVGRTGQRKGTAWNEVEPLLTRADPTFKEQILGGLSSGEGLIYAVRDSQLKKSKNGDFEVSEPGVEDKRLFAIEEEFGGMLQRAKREGNTLSAVIRQAWDSGTLRVMTKQPVAATGSHIGIIGHITNDELLKTLNDNETANGFANRFLWVCVKRSKFLPDGDSVPETDINEIVYFLRETLNFSRMTGEITRDAAASDYWHTIYEPLNSHASGLLGTVTSRAAVQTLRIAALYALLDFKETISFEHLEAAHHLWQYAFDSARYIFGVATGDKTADKIYIALTGYPEGLTRTQIIKVFSNHLTKTELTRGLQILIETGKVNLISEKTLGRPKEIFKAVE